MGKIVTSRCSHNFCTTNSNCFLQFSKLQLLLVIITPNPKFLWENYAPSYCSTRRYTQLPLLLDIILQQQQTVHTVTITVGNSSRNSDFEEFSSKFPWVANFDFLTLAVFNSLDRACCMYRPTHFPDPVSVITLRAAANREPPH